ncbi:MAG: hypothetical protein V8S92_01610 [Oscillospiraceae bacterium]
MMLPIGQYAALSTLENLWPYLDADPGYSRDSLLSRPVEVAQVDGKALSAAPSTSASPRQSASAGSSAITRHGRWLMSRTRSASCPKARWYSTSITPSSDMFTYRVAINAKGFMEWQNGTRNFDSDEFRALLESVKLLPAEFSWQSDEEYESDSTRMKSGKQLLYPMNLNRL